jgi:hypothetical protein
MCISSNFFDTRRKCYSVTNHERPLLLMVIRYFGVLVKERLLYFSCQILPSLRALLFLGRGDRIGMVDLKFSDVMEDIGQDITHQDSDARTGCVMIYRAGIWLLARQLPSHTVLPVQYPRMQRGQHVKRRSWLMKSCMYLFKRLMHIHVCGYVSINNSCHEILESISYNYPQSSLYERGLQKSIAATTEIWNSPRNPVRPILVHRYDCLTEHLHSSRRHSY